jgi:hypothetical protein
MADDPRIEELAKHVADLETAQDLALATLALLLEERAPGTLALFIARLEATMAAIPAGERAASLTSKLRQLVLLLQRQRGSPGAARLQ